MEPAVLINIEGGLSFHHLRCLLLWWEDHIEIVKTLQHIKKNVKDACKGKLERPKVKRAKQGVNNGRIMKCTYYFDTHPTQSQHFVTTWIMNEAPQITVLNILT